MYNRLYIHVPFCVEKCHYCAFISSKPQSSQLLEYPELLRLELQLHSASSQPLESIYFGGGTPSLLLPAQIAGILEEMAKRNAIQSDAEITIEANPGTISIDTLKGFYNAGINRISMGIQSFDNLFLKILGRIHTADQARLAFQNARSAGFGNISIDLIHSLPGQSLDQWRTELQQAIAFCPEHISIYGLTVEDNTVFAHMYPPDSPDLVDEDLSADMFECADELLTKAGFDHYEIANYSRPGRRSQHNSGYWKRDGYLGIGVAAHSFLRDGFGVRFSNPDNLEEYRLSVESGQLSRIDLHQLSQAEAMAEYLFLGLRLAEGINIDVFEREFGCSLEAVYGSTPEDLVRGCLLERQGRNLALTLRGMLLSNQVFARFIL
jgi:oxygen-independent coproporphyrinogen-3 oxidase